MRLAFALAGLAAAGLRTERTPGNADLTCERGYERYINSSLHAYACRACPAFFTSGHEGASEFEMQRWACRPCEPGTFSTAGDASCTPCPAGQYSQLFI